MGDRRFDRDIARLAIPALITLLAEPVYLLVDTAIVGHLGTSQLGGLAIAAAILLTVHSLTIFLAYGTTAAVARLVGAGEQRRALEQGIQGLWLALLVGVAAAIALLAEGRTLIGLFGADREVSTNALVYLRISAMGIPALLIGLAATGYLRGIQDTRTPLVVSVAAATANLVVELALVLGLGFGIGASALSTVLAQVGAAVAYLVIIGRGAAGGSVALRPAWAIQRRLVRVGGDLIVRTAALRGSLLALTVVAARIGSTAVAAHQVAFEVWSFLAMGLDALAIAAQALVGRLLGASAGDDARAASRRLLAIGLVAGAATGAVVLAASPWLGRAFSDDADVLATVRTLLWWVAVLQPLAVVAFVLDGVLIGAGDQRFLAVAMVAAAAAMAVALVPVVALDLGVAWLWGAFGVLMAVRAATLIVRFRGGRWAVEGAARPRSAAQA